MKKYKLIKEYPGSAKLHTIANAIYHISHKTTNEEDEYVYKLSDEFHQPLPKDKIEKYPEFWEEVCEKCSQPIPTCKIINSCKEPNFLITAFTDNKGKFVKVMPNGNYNHEDWKTPQGVSLDEMLNDRWCVKSGHYHIHSVKNKEGVEFSISDKFMPMGGQCQRVIKSFTIVSDYIQVNTECGLDYFLNKILKCPKSIFTSADGKDMFEGDKYYVPQVDFIDRLTGTYLEFTTESSISNSVITRFSTKELAQEYIDNNKPKYSLKDYELVIKNMGFMSDSGIYGRIKEELKKLGK